MQESDSCIHHKHCYIVKQLVKSEKTMQNQKQETYVESLKYREEI